MNYEHILVEINNPIATLIFKRPKALNALNTALLSEFGHALNDIEKNSDIRVLVLTGAGDKAFVAGADISELSNLNALQGREFVRHGHEVIGRLQSLWIPVIAAVNGFALGGGTEIAITCDLIYASEKAKFGLPEINLGIIPGFGGTQRLSRLIGINKAKELIFTGKTISAQEAKTLGLVNEVFPNELLMEKVMETAKLLAEKGKVALRAAKQAINNGMNVDICTGCQLEIDAFGLCISSPDAKEGTTAFLEKRKPQFKASYTD
ncbi:MAG: enoyl-CoA hydratase/isomerase family protein [Desulfobacterales bacterium]|nr:enoyl-CoA hydratase/isomerase family protein [Desulfobacterales bacterium]